MIVVLVLLFAGMFVVGCGVVATYYAERHRDPFAVALALGLMLFGLMLGRIALEMVP